MPQWISINPTWRFFISKCHVGFSSRLFAEKGRDHTAKRTDLGGPGPSNRLYAGVSGEVRHLHLARTLRLVSRPLPAHLSVFLLLFTKVRRIFCPFSAKANCRELALSLTRLCLANRSNRGTRLNSKRDFFAAATTALSFRRVLFFLVFTKLIKEDLRSW